MRIALVALILATSGGVQARSLQVDQAPPPPGAMRGGGIGALMRADGNGDGVVTREEAIASADAMFDRLDTNHDGQVSPDEAMAGRGFGMRRGTPPAGDGETGAAPPPPPTGAAPPPPPVRGGAMTPLSRQQWRDRALRQFDRVDADHDGKVDRAEIARYQDAMRARRLERRGGGDAPPPSPAGQAN